MDLARYGFVRAARRPIAAIAVVLLPVAFFTWLSLSSGLNPWVPFRSRTFSSSRPSRPLRRQRHWFWPSVRIGAYRVLFVSLGFFVMGFLYAVDGLTTSGVLLAGDPASFDRSVAGASAFVGLCLPSLFFAAAYTGLISFLERRPLAPPRDFHLRST